MTASMDREIWRLPAEVASLRKQVQDQGVMIREMRDVLVATKGSWKLLVGVAGLAATLSAWWSRLLNGVIIIAIAMATELGYIMVQTDALAGTGIFLSKAEWWSGAEFLPEVGKAVTALGGTQ